MYRLDHFRQIVDPEILGAIAGVEAAVESEIDGIGPVLHRRMQTLPVAGRREQLGGTSVDRRLVIHPSKYDKMIKGV
jgi:hypothetical protein